MDSDIEKNNFSLTPPCNHQVDLLVKFLLLKPMQAQNYQKTEKKYRTGRLCMVH